VNPISKRFGHSRLAIGTGLGSAIGIDFLKVHPTLPTNPLQQTQKRSKRCINTLFAEHSSVQPNSVEICRAKARARFANSKNSLCLVAKKVGVLQVKVFATIGNVMMEFGYLNLCFFPVFRTFFLPCRSALQHFQPTLQSFKELWTLHIQQIAGL
jgi:hypothetical protein